jgi:pyruvate dehydrogenase E2 component (dihydrolipoamide acetyltransferase)
VSELRGTTKPFTTLQAAVARNMNESLKVRFLQAHRVQQH